MTAIPATDGVTLTWRRAALRIGAPLALAAAIVSLEGPLTTLVASRPGILPVTMVAMLVALLVTRARRWLIVVLCFGIGAMAVRDVFRPIPIPPQIDYVLVATLFPIVYPIVWGILAALAGVAGVIEALVPGTVWARRCYFGAAALYLGGHGLLNYMRQPNWEAIVLMACGAVSVVGVITSNRIIAAEAPPEPEPEDIAAMEEDIRQRAERVAAKEWQ